MKGLENLLGFFMNLVWWKIRFYCFSNQEDKVVLHEDEDEDVLHKELEKHKDMLSNI